MEQLWEKKWRSFRRTEPQSAPEYKRTAHNKPILRREDNEVLLRELTDHEYEQVSHIVAGLDEDYLSFNNIFQGKKRIVIPFVPGPTGELEELISFFDNNGYNIEWEDGTASKEVQTQRGKQIRKVKVGKTLNKAISLKKKYDQAYGTLVELTSELNYLENTRIEQRQEEIMKNNPDKTSWEARAESQRIEQISVPSPEMLKIKQQKIKAQELKNQAYERLVNEFPHHDSVHKLESMLKFWNERSEFYRKNPQAVEGEKGKYSLVITRAPIDVLRMSDFDDINSCHSPPSRHSDAGGGYYQCAVAEANGHGPIVYVVENDDIPEDFDWEEEEVFEDDHRAVGEITPVSRLRVKKYVHNDGGYSIAVPGKRVYGRKFPNLVPAVVDFFRKMQPDIVANPPEDVEEFTHVGGSYRDNSDGSLFNQFFESDDYAGNAPHETDSAEYDEYEEEDTIEQWEAQCEEIDRQYNRFNHAYASYEVDDHGNGPYVMMNGGIQVEIDDDEFVQELPDWRGMRVLIGAIEREISIGVGEIDYDSYQGHTTFRIEADANYVEQNPDGYQYFLDNEVDELDNNYDGIVRAIRKVLVDEGYLSKSPYDKLRLDAEAIEDVNDLYKHFMVEVESDGEILVNLQEGHDIPIDVSLLVPEDVEGEKIPRAYSSSGVQLPHEIRKKILSTLNSDGFRHDFWTGIVRMIEQAAKQMSLPGLNDEENMEDEVRVRMPFEDLDFGMERSPEKRGEQPWTGFVDFELKLTGMQDNEDVIVALKLVQYIDDNYERVAKFMNATFQKTVKSVNNVMKQITGLEETEKLVNNILKEIEPYQAEMRRKHPKWKKMTIGLGGNKSSGGGPFTKKPSMKRSKSAPPAGVGE